MMVTVEIDGVLTAPLQVDVLHDLQSPVTVSIAEPVSGAASVLVLPAELAIAEIETIAAAVSAVEVGAAGVIVLQGPPGPVSPPLWSTFDW